MLNILFVIDRLHTGGTEKQLYELIKGLDESRIQVHVCVLNTPGGTFFDRLNVPKIALAFTRFYHPSIVYDIKHLSEYIRKNRIEIVQTFFQDSTLLVALTRPFHSAKLIGSFRDLGFWRTMAQNLKMRLAYPMYSGFIANSQAAKDYVVKVDGITAEKIQVIYNGFDLKQLDGMVKRTLEPPVVGIVANLNRSVKRVQDFVYAAALVHEQMPDVQFSVVGGGHLETDLEQLAKSLGLSDHIKFVGMIENPLEMVTEWSVGVITSETEGFCNALLEYMACGLPVVATDTGGNPELISDGENGFLVPVDMPAKLAEQILVLLNDSSLSAKMAENNLLKISGHFSVASMLDTHCDYYRRLLCRK